MKEQAKRELLPIVKGMIPTTAILTAMVYTSGITVQILTEVMALSQVQVDMLVMGFVPVYGVTLLLCMKKFVDTKAIMASKLDR